MRRICAKSACRILRGKSVCALCRALTASTNTASTAGLRYPIRIMKNISSADTLSYYAYRIQLLKPDLVFFCLQFQKNAVCPICRIEIREELQKNN